MLIGMSRESSYLMGHIGISTKEYTTYEDLEKGAQLIARLIQMPWE